MKLIFFLSDFIIPFSIFYILGYGLSKRRPVYEDFTEGAKDGIKTVFHIMPTIIGLMAAVEVLRASGFLDALSALLERPAALLRLPACLIPVIIIKIFSSSAADGLVTDIFSLYGPDSFCGLAASIMMGCTETIVFTMSVYFAAAHVRRGRWTLAGALVATMAGTIASLYIAGRLLPGAAF